MFVGLYNDVLAYPINYASYPPLASPLYLSNVHWTFGFFSKTSQKSVRQFRQRSLAYFRYNFAVITLATYLASGRYSCALGTCTLWTFSKKKPHFKELLIYLPFKAHTQCIINCFGKCLFGKFLRNFLAFVFVY